MLLLVKLALMEPSKDYNFTAHATLVMPNSTVIPLASQLPLTTATLVSFVYWVTVDLVPTLLSMIWLLILQDSVLRVTNVVLVMLSPRSA